MWKQGGSRSSALDRAMAQLAGKTIPNTGGSQINENVNLKGLLPGRRIEFKDLSDISSEDVYSEDHEESVAPPRKAVVDNELSERSVVGGGSRFLKKPTNAIADRQSSAPCSQRLSTEEPARTPQRRSQSAALSRLSQFEERFRHRKVSNAQTGSPRPISPEEAAISAHSSSDLSIKEAHFLKKKLSSNVPEQSNQTHSPHIAVKAPPSRVPSKGVILDSDEEDMRRLLGRSLNSSPESPRPTEKKNARKRTPTAVNISDTFRRRTPLPPSSEQASPIHSLRSVSIVYSPSPSPPNIQTSSRRSPKGRFLRPARAQSAASVNNEIKSLEELFTDTDDTISERSAASDVFKLNIMTLDDLIPAEPLGLLASSKEKVGGAQDVSRGDDAAEDASERTLDDIFPEDKGQPEESAVEYESDFESDVKSEATYKSLSEIPEHLTDDDRVSEPAEDQSEERSHYHPSRTDTDTNSEASLVDRTETYSRKSFESHESKSKDSFSKSYSSYSRSDTLTPTSEPHSGCVKEAAVQTEGKGLAFTWPSGMDALASTYMEPTPVARYTVNAEALEALIAQKPVEAALNDMLKQQLTLTRHFIESSRQLYSSLLQSLEPPDYKYTTLEDTKEYIRKHRPSKLTIEEALEEVQQEMREYHYL